MKQPLLVLLNFVGVVLLTVGVLYPVSYAFSPGGWVAAFLFFSMLVQGAVLVLFGGIQKFSRP